MTKGDRYQKDILEKILEEGYLDENPRPHYADGTPAHTYSINHIMTQYDLSKGECPILTLRPIAWKSAVKEILWIYQMQSNKLSDLHKLGIKYWDEWDIGDGTIGRAYPYNLESHRPHEMKRNVIKVAPKMVDKKYSQLAELPKFNMISPIDKNVYFNRYVVIEKDCKKDEKHNYSMIQFVNSGYKMLLRNDSIGLHKCTDPYERTVYGIGYLGDYNTNNFEKWEIDALKKKWTNMLKRCYSELYRKDAPTYKDVFVHNRWHCFANFLEDVRFLPQYFLAKEDKFEGWHLDKDYYASNAYSKETCVFLKLKENVTYARTNGCYKIIDKDNNEYFDLTIAGFAESANLNLKQLRRAINKNKSYNGFTILFLENTNEYVYRYELSRNQIVELLNGLKNNPYGRRNIVSLWHWANIDKKALVECAYETIWNVRKGKDGEKYLDMMLTQRSSDFAISVSINELQYVALLLMVARHCGYKPGMFTHVTANVQIYDRHIEQAKELIRRPTIYCHPQLVLKEGKTNFYKFTIDDFELVDYPLDLIKKENPQLKFDLGI